MTDNKIVANGEDYTPRNYVNAWLTDTMKSQLYGEFKGSDAKPARITWDADKKTVRADIMNTSTMTPITELFGVPISSISEARFEGTSFGLTVQGKRHRFVIANDEFTKDIDIYGPNNAMRAASYIEDLVMDPAMDDLRILRRLLESQNVKIIKIRLVRSILVGLGVTFIILAILYFALSIYVRSQTK